jgi:hypothetical protein
VWAAVAMAVAKTIAKMVARILVMRAVAVR